MILLVAAPGRNRQSPPPSVPSRPRSFSDSRPGVPSRPRSAVARALAMVGANAHARTTATAAYLALRGRDGTPPRLAWGLPGLVVGVALLSGVAGAGCGASGNERAREYMPDMARGPAYKAFAPNAATRTGLTLQAPVAGTIARGHRQFQFHYGAGEEEAARAGRELANPLPPTAATLEDGRGLYQTYCLVCHGASGKGDGPLVVSGKIPTPPSYSSERVAPFPPGRLFHVVTMGTQNAAGAQKMPSYAALLTPNERWKVVGYVASKLQGSATP